MMMYPSTVKKICLKHNMDLDKVPKDRWAGAAILEVVAKERKCSKKKVIREYGLIRTLRELGFDNVVLAYVLLQAQRAE
jgi:hypothetical protein